MIVVEPKGRDRVLVKLLRQENTYLLMTCYRSYAPLRWNVTDAQGRKLARTRLKRAAVGYAVTRALQEVSK